MDYLTVDPETHRLYVPRSTHTLVIDAVSGETVGDIPGQKRAHGVAIVPKLNRGFITDGGDGTVTVFDLKTNACLASSRRNQMRMASSTIRHRSYSSERGRQQQPDYVQAEHRSQVGPYRNAYPPGGAPEFLAADGFGKVFVNLEDKDTVAVVDLKTRKVIARWPVSPGGAPVGMSNRHPASHLVYRMPQTAEDDRDGYGERKSAGRSAYRSRSGCNQGQRF